VHRQARPSFESDAAFMNVESHKELNDSASSGPMTSGPVHAGSTVARAEAPPRAGADPADAAAEATIKATMAWVNQLGRTLKTCRLYDANNPTVVRFREELAVALGRLLDLHGALTLRFTSDDVLLDEASLYPARSRDDNLALPFYRDGIR